MKKITGISRRHMLGTAAGFAIVAALPAHALSPSAAEDFIKGIIEDLHGLLNANADGPAGASRFLTLLEQKAAVPQVGKFAAGRAWRDMSDAQQAAYQEAFRTYISRTYRKRFNDYGGEDIIVNGSVDAGAKGVLVKSTLVRPNGQKFAIEWLVSERSGPVALADIVFEGVSLSITLRELFGGMLDKRNGDIDQFITDLSQSEGA